jgi:hypothetical protein
MRIEQIDQLWEMDDMGMIHSVSDYNRCMMVQSDAGTLDEAGVEIGPCDEKSLRQKFKYDKSTATLKLRGDGFSTHCMTFLGTTANKGSPLIMEKCESEDKFGWDFISEKEYGQPSPPPTAAFLPLKYEGRNGCTPDSPCDVCTGDCDGDDGCLSGLFCFQRAKDETSQVPGCEVGGAQDIPGADYCYSPDAPLPSLIWLGTGKDACTMSKPCNRCVGACVKDSDCKGNLKCFKREEGETDLIPGCRGGGEDDIPGASFFRVASLRLVHTIPNSFRWTTQSSGGDYCYDSNAPAHATVQPSRLPTQLIPLRWRGSDGCSPESPCPTCTGDCDDDSDCESPLQCFKRYAGDRNQVPGCDVGGLGDIPGGDYCYDPELSPETTTPTSSGQETPTYDPTNSPTEQVLGPS